MAPRRLSLRATRSQRKAQAAHRRAKKLAIRRKNAVVRDQKQVLDVFTPLSETDSTDQKQVLERFTPFSEVDSTDQSRYWPSSQSVASSNTDATSARCPSSPPTVFSSPAKKSAFGDVEDKEARTCSDNALTLSQLAEASSNAGDSVEVEEASKSGLTWPELAEQTARAGAQQWEMYRATLVGILRDIDKESVPLVPRVHETVKFLRHLRIFADPQAWAMYHERLMLLAHRGDLDDLCIGDRFRSIAEICYVAEEPLTETYEGTQRHIDWERRRVALRTCLLLAEMTTPVGKVDGAEEVAQVRKYVDDILLELGWMQIMQPAEEAMFEEMFDRRYEEDNWDEDLEAEEDLLAWGDEE